MILIKNIEEYNKIKDKIAFVYYGKLDYKEIISYFSLGQWLKREPKIYLLNQNIYKIIKDEKLNESYEEVALILIDDIIKNISINEEFEILYDDSDKKTKSEEHKIYGRVKKIWKKSFGFKPYCFEVKNKTNLQINDNFINIFKKFEYIYVKSCYEKDFISDLPRYEGYHIDILETSFKSMEGLTKKLNSTYNCQIKDSMLSLIDINNNLDIFFHVFAPDIDEQDLYEEDKNFVENGIKKVEEVLGKFTNMYMIEDDIWDSQISPFGANFNQFCIIFKKYTLVITFGTDE